MSDADRVTLENEQSDLQRKLSMRLNQPGYTDNCKAIKARLETIEKELSEDG